MNNETIVRDNDAGNLVFHGPREEVVPFFESMHFFVPERKAVSDFLQEVTSMKDQKVRHGKITNLHGCVRLLPQIPTFCACTTFAYSHRLLQELNHSKSLRVQFQCLKNAWIGR